MDWGQGARMALPIWGYYMQEVYKDTKLNLSKGDFEMPQGYDTSILNCNDPSNIGGELPEFF
jgi:penicillin-binding protein 1A